MRLLQGLVRDKMTISIKYLLNIKENRTKVLYTPACEKLKGIIYVEKYID